MDGLCRAIGSTIPVTLAGSTYLLSPLTLGMLGTIEHLLLSRRSTPLDTAKAMCERIKDEALQEQILDRAQRDMRRRKELARVEWPVICDWLDSAEGVEFTAWLCLRPEHPLAFATLERARAILARSSAKEREEFTRRRDQASGMHWFSVVDWPRQPPAGRGGGAGNGEGKRQKPLSWRDWLARVMDEYPGIGLAEIRGWTLDNVRAALAPRGKQKRSRKSEEGEYGERDMAESGVGRQMRKRGLL